MLCQSCGQRLATGLVTRNVMWQKIDEFLCDRCAAIAGHTAVPWWGSLFGSILPGPSLFGYPAYTGPPRKEPAGLVCPSCGETERQLKETGLLGCEQCYDTFAAVLEPVFRRVQGHTRHIEALGKSRESDELSELRQRLDAAIREEAYEEAAGIRYEIRNHERSKEGDD